MDHSATLRVFRAQSENVRALDRARGTCKRAINRDLIAGDENSLAVNTRFYAMLFSAWAEAKLQKTVFTPHGLTVAEIQAVQTKVKSNIEQGFLACLDVALPKVFGPKNASFLPNARKKMSNLINSYIVKPYELRNKFAHGQWVSATKADYSDIHADITARISLVDAVEIERWFLAHQSISHLMEMLISSPRKGFTQQYWPQVTKAESDLKAAEKWTMAQKLDQLKRKKAPFMEAAERNAKLAEWALLEVIPELEKSGKYSPASLLAIPNRNGVEQSSEVSSNLLAEPSEARRE